MTNRHMTVKINDITFELATNATLADAVAEFGIKPQYCSDTKRWRRLMLLMQ